MHYVPIGLSFFLALFFLFLLLVVLIELRVLQYAYGRIGVSPRYMLALLLLSFLGSYVNIPVVQLPPEQVYSDKIVTFFGVPHVVPAVTHWPGTVIAVNLGGAVVPAILSVYLVLKNRLYGSSLAAVAVVTTAVHAMASPVPGVGIVVPIFLPPVVAAISALVVSRRHAAPLAYIGGALGTLIGGDLLNLDKVQGLGAPVASIGGAGKFDSIFLTAILAVLLASLFTRRRRASDTG